MGALLGLLLGVGLLLIWRSGSRAPARQAASTPGRVARRIDLLRQAGVDGISSAQLLGAQLASALVAGLLVHVVA